MKTRLTILVLLIVCFSCGTNNKPISDAQKEKIKGEIKEVTNRMFQGCEEANFEMATESFHVSPDFIFLINGYALRYEDFVDAVKPVFGSLLNQKVTIVDEKYAIIDKTTVLYTANTEFLENFKDGHSILNDPTVILCAFKKIDNKWRTIYAVESYISQGVVGSEATKELNQVELFKQFIGTWKCELAKDTTLIVNVKSYGDGLDYYIKTVTKGKILMEGKALMGFDKNSDKGIQAEILNSPNITLWVYWFTSKNICETIQYQYISNPESAPKYVLFEFKSPDLLVQTFKENNKTISSFSFLRER